MKMDKIETTLIVLYILSMFILTALKYSENWTAIEAYIIMDWFQFLVLSLFVIYYMTTKPDLNSRVIMLIMVVLYNIYDYMEVRAKVLLGVVCLIFIGLLFKSPKRQQQFVHKKKQKKYQQKKKSVKKK